LNDVVWKPWPPEGLGEPLRPVGSPSGDTEELLTMVGDGPGRGKPATADTFQPFGEEAGDSYGPGFGFPPTPPDVPCRGDLVTSGSVLMTTSF
jgi:hypothetical protein